MEKTRENICEAKCSRVGSRSLLLLDANATCSSRSSRPKVSSLILFSNFGFEQNGQRLNEICSTHIVVNKQIPL